MILEFTNVIINHQSSLELKSNIYIFFTCFFGRPSSEQLFILYVLFTTYLLHTGYISIYVIKKVQKILQVKEYIMIILSHMMNELNL